jgi:hypothetical protein
MIIAISGKINSGKDTVGKIIQYLVIKSQGYDINWKYFTNINLVSEQSAEIYSNWKIKKFASNVTKAFEIINNVNYHKLDRETKEKVRPSYIKFAENCKKIFGKSVWINSLMSEYNYQLHNKKYNSDIAIYPNWIITDMRFLNEMRAVKSKNGITIRINKKDYNYEFKEDKTEIELDNAIFNYEINNSGTIEELIEKVKKVLIKEKII